jgi:adenylate cyclase class 2
MLEVEVKVRWIGGEKPLLDLGVEFTGEVVQEDQYYQHPCRDFLESGEAFRLRREDGRLLLTYKGPRLDTDTKTRREIEFPIDGEMEAVLAELGFRRAGYVRKKRRNYQLDDVLLCLDEVEGLGSYLELETSKQEDKELLFDILGRLGVDKKESITDSYLELLSLKDAQEKEGD